VGGQARDARRRVAVGSSGWELACGCPGASHALGNIVRRNNKEQTVLQEYKVGRLMKEQKKKRVSFLSGNPTFFFYI
jgi:hypothetical protein